MNIAGHRGLSGRGKEAQFLVKHHFDLAWVNWRVKRKTREAELAAGYRAGLGMVWMGRAGKEKDESQKK